MTREEAIRGLKMLRKDFSGYKPNEEMFDMAIEALEQKPREDVISRQEVLDLVNADWKYENLEADIASLPLVTPQPKMGHWIIIDDCEQFIAKCSECGRIEDSRMISKYPYCHCGAKMIKSEE